MGERKLSGTEYVALQIADKGMQSVDDIPEKVGKDVWGEPVPGMRTYVKLEKMGLLVLTEEEPVTLQKEGEEPFEFTFTAFVEITDEGRQAMKVFENELHGIPSP